MAIMTYYCVLGWLESVRSRVVNEIQVDYRKPILYVVTIQRILDKLPVGPVSATGTIPHRMRNTFQGDPGGTGDGS